MVDKIDRPDTLPVVRTNPNNNTVVSADGVATYLAAGGGGGSGGFEGIFVESNNVNTGKKMVCIERESTTQMIGLAFETSATGKVNVTQLVKNSPARNAGIKVGHRILSINHIRVAGALLHLERVRCWPGCCLFFWSGCFSALLFSAAVGGVVLLAGFLLFGFYGVILLLVAHFQ
jgi:hypothetical protein